MSSTPITHLALHLGPNVGANDALIGVRVVPAGRDGNKIIAKTLNQGQPDSGEGITRHAGEKLLLPPGNARITIQDVDKENSPHADGYAAASNTIWLGSNLARRLTQYSSDSSLPPRDGSIQRTISASIRLTIW